VQQVPADASNAGEPALALLASERAHGAAEMTPFTFKGYGVNASDVTVVLEHITHWWPIDYNGLSGTELVLDTGKSLRVGHYTSDVEKAVKAAVGK
jgi:hypothetical protein